MKKILLVADNAFLINIYASQFRKFGYSTTVARSGEAVEAKIKNINPDLLIFDVDDNKGETFSTLRKLRENADLRGLKIVALSSFDSKEDHGAIPVPFAVFHISKTENTAADIIWKIERLLN